MLPSASTLSEYRCSARDSIRKRSLSALSFPTPCELCISQTRAQRPAAWQIRSMLRWSDHYISPDQLILWASPYGRWTTALVGSKNTIRPSFQATGGSAVGDASWQKAVYCHSTWGLDQSRWYGVIILSPPSWIMIGINWNLQAFLCWCLKSMCTKFHQDSSRTSARRSFFPWWRMKHRSLKLLLLRRSSPWMRSVLVAEGSIWRGNETSTECILQPPRALWRVCTDRIGQHLERWYTIVSSSIYTYALAVYQQWEKLANRKKPLPYFPI